jgi:energy-coupling factor transporter ATP-binding protein EcfA2
MITATPDAPANDTVTIENLGPIEYLELPAKPGTIVVLRGQNGGGKSTALQAINALATKKPAGLTSHDGTTGGRISAWDATIKVARNGQNRRLGDLTVVALEDRVDIAALVDPGLKDEAAADLRRIKSLCNLVGAAVTLDDLYALVGGREEFEAIVKKESMAIQDPIQLVEAVKRDFEAAARAQTTTAENAHRAAVAKLAENDGLDLNAPCDAQLLQADLTEAVQRQSRLQSERRAWEAAQARAAEAQQQLDQVAAKYQGPTVAVAQAALDGMEAAVADQASAVEDLQRKLMEATSRLALLRSERNAAKSQLESAKSHDSAIAGWKLTIEAATSDCPASDAEISSAAAAVQDAQAAAERGTRIRDGLRRAEEAKAREAEAEAARKRSDRFREAAQGTLDVLAQSVRAVSDRIDFDSTFRLVVKHPSRGKCFFADLSHGERWALALDMVIETARQRDDKTVLTIPQEAWEGLDGRNRALIESKVSGSTITVYTAEADRAEDPAGIAVEVLGASA